MAPSSTVKTTNPKKEKVFHPASRKAGQLARNALRKGKLGNLSTKRSQKHHSLVDLYGFFYHAMPEEGVLSLQDLHHIVSDIWLTRFDEDLEKERSARRKGRPKSSKEIKLEERKLQEAELYRTGMEIIDLTHGPTVEIFRRWDKKELAFIQLLRFIRISSSEPEVVVLSKPGKHLSILESTTVSEGGDAMDVVMEKQDPTVSQLPQFGEPPLRFSSTMMTMDNSVT
ncbi:hypothetical protein BYT27DRAFT_7199066 [Phlegmacium glaucopus]|nr:hypothetical protein BYT27DRAFT_7199066 [Phlegmacium glaucopus]